MLLHVESVSPHPPPITFPLPIPIYNIVFHYKEVYLMNSSMDDHGSILTIPNQKMVVKKSKQPDVLNPILLIISEGNPKYHPDPIE